MADNADVTSSEAVVEPLGGQSEDQLDAFTPTPANPAPAPTPPIATPAWRLGPLEALQAASVLGTVCYGASWLMAWSLFSKFHLRPEDVGLGIDFLLVRSTLLGILLALTLGGLLMPTVYGNWLARGRSGDLRPFHQAYFFGLAALTGLTVAAVLVTMSYLMSDSGYRMPIALRCVVAIVLAGILAYVEGSVILVGVGYQAGHPKGPGLGDEFRVGALVGAMAIPLLLLAVASWTTGSVLAERIKADQPYTAIFNVHDVRVLSLSSVVSSRRTVSRDPVVLACGLLLGYGDGVVRIYHPESNRVSSFSTQDVVVVDDGRHIDRDCPTQDL